MRQYGSGKCLLTIAPQAGSYGYYHVSQRALDSWLTKGGIVDPSSSRKFDISDGVFEPGLYPLIPDGDNGLIVPAINTDRIELRTRVGTCYVAVLDDETVEIDAPVTVKVGGAAATEPAMQGSKFITKYNAHTHSTAFGPSGAPIVPWVPADNSTKVKIG
ncbi:MAG: hypothetical protein GWN96_06460 [candidate division Zixibacteria bacterium]|nr:hypothetical protein [candidate division Zixibacteria bacterium]